jgi:hypothetical protein
MSSALGVDSMQRKVHDTAGKFGEDLVKEAVEWAKREKGGELTEPVEFQATVTVSPTEPPFCIKIGSIIICVGEERPPVM